ncbi:MAG: nucleotidyltransferase family protein [Clostridium sp.]|nr:nucleotidyltransferase family protein [Acetatifactor muris]MCM1527880.1 nucleotidyltransferase family protein [Bacteroides sp.]MCM1563922.1 nucleotidyltransferase family protein [Clostridium sp.]
MMNDRMHRKKHNAPRTERTAEERLLLTLLREALRGEVKGQSPGFSPGEPPRETRTGESADTLPEETRDSADWQQLIHMAERHGVLPLLYDQVAEGENMPADPGRRVTEAARRTVQQSYRLLFLSKYLIGELERAGISVILLKGAGTAAYYPVPEYRKAGDVDLLLLRPGELTRAGEVLERLGCVRVEEQPSLHHVVYRADEGIEVEVHTLPAEPFDNARVNRYMEEWVSDCAQYIQLADLMGVRLPVPGEADHAFALLLHMLQHFLRSGFGLKLLCDWVVFWNRETDGETRERYLRLVTESRVKGFSDMVTLTCCRYLGLSKKYVTWMRLPDRYETDLFLSEILEAEEFGRSSEDRMVALRGNSPADYIREFHHQMCLNFPRGSRVIPCWPFLWLITLGRFVRNNRKVRNTTGRAILQEAGRRGKIASQIGLFRVEKEGSGRGKTDIG